MMRTLMLATHLLSVSLSESLPCFSNGGTDTLLGPDCHRHQLLHL